jgi:large subunit ribosomal protein L23
MAKKQEIDARHYDVILGPHITEKSTMASEHNAVVFKVASDATKPQIKNAVEALFDVKVTGVNTIALCSDSRVDFSVMWGEWITS